MAKAKLLTLTEVSNRTGISMPTLQRYKKEYQDRIPSEGEGRKQRYPRSALAVFQQIKKENIKRRGRPAKKAPAVKPAARRGSGRKAGGRRKAAAPATPARQQLLSLTEVGKQTGISYPTLARYVKLHGAKIPSEGTGRKRRYHPEAVEVFKELRSQSRRGGGRRKAAAGRRAAGSSGPDAGLARRIAALEKSVRELTALVKRPIKVTLGR